MSSFKIIKGSCVDQEVDAIVNPANSYMLHGGGVAAQIALKAGYELTKACREHNLPIKVGEVITTPSFNIKNTKIVIHAVGPNFNETDDINLLFNAYYNSLIALKDNNYHTIAFPLISTGIFKGNLKNPLEVSTQELLKANNKFIKDYPNYKINIKLCIYNSNDYIEVIKTIKEDKKPLK